MVHNIEHHPCERRDGEDVDHGESHQDDEEDEEAAGEGRQPTARPGADVDHGLPQHGAAAHAAESAAKDVSDALTHAFPHDAASCLRTLIDEAQCHDGLEEADGCHNDSERVYLSEGGPGGRWHLVAAVEPDGCREGTAGGSQIADDGRVAVEDGTHDAPLDGRADDDAAKGRGHALRELRQEDADQERDDSDDRCKDCLLTCDPGLPIRE
mmetsp:Transcript_55371/g.177618  ORF Transcript_55371/g.177618 Transcript_55371/m.177618 type:complete len:211 (-) Transcript_55371:752-1384(-)